MKNKNQEEINCFLNNVKENLPKEDIINILDFTMHGEWGLAFETLCIQIYEYDVPITRELYEKISLYGKSIKIDESIYLPLLELIK